MPDTPIKVLFVEDNPGDVRLVHELLTQTFGKRFLLIDAVDLASGKERIQSEEFDAVLLDPHLPDAGSPESIIGLAAVPGAPPIIVLTGDQNEDVVGDAFKAGAQDYLFKDTMNAEIIDRSIRYAIERHGLARALTTARTASERDREWLALEQMSQSSSASATASSYGEPSLEASSPDVWDLLVLEYAGLIKSALDDRAYRDEAHQSSRIRGVAQRLGTLRAQPRDIVKIHVAAIKKAGENVGPRTRAIIVEEARLLLIEVLGNLASYYRSFMGPAPFRPLHEKGA